MKGPSYVPKSTMTAPEASVLPELMAEPSGFTKATLAPAPKAPKAGTTLIGLTMAGGTGGTGGGTGVTGVTGVVGVVVVDEPPPHPAKNASGRIKEARILEIFMVDSLNGEKGSVQTKYLKPI
jgi:hypothetical protein